MGGADDRDGSVNVGLDGPCAKSAEGRVAAVINRAGVSDFVDVLHGADAKPWARYWFQTLPNAAEVAKAVSPLTLVKAGGPPVICTW